MLELCNVARAIERRDGAINSVNRLLTENPRLNLAQFFMILRDLLETFQNQCAYPYAEIRRDHVHQTETSDDFEAMDVQLRIIS